MTLRLARNFLLLSFVSRAAILKYMKALDEDEHQRLHRGNHDEVMEMYKLAFGRIKERKQIEALEHAIQDYI